MQDYVVLTDCHPDVARRRRASLDVSTVRGARGMSEYLAIIASRRVPEISE